VLNVKNPPSPFHAKQVLAEFWANSGRGLVRITRAHAQRASREAGAARYTCIRDTYPIQAAGYLQVTLLFKLGSLLVTRWCARSDKSGHWQELVLLP
jgi:hypothetical protein